MTGMRLGAVSDDLARLFDRGSVAGLTDEALLRRYLEGGDAAEAAFAAIVARHGAMVRGACRRVVGDRHEADDAFQATFLVLARRARSVRVDGSLGPWLYGVAVRVASRARARASRTAVGLDEVDPRAPTEGPTLAERAELRAAIDAEIARLPRRDRAAVVLCHVEGLDQREAARRLRCPVGTLQGRLQRGRQRLRRGLARRGLAPASVGIGLALVGASAGAVPRSMGAELARLAVADGTVPAGVASLVRGWVRRTVMRQVGGIAALVLGFVATGAGLVQIRASGGDEARPAPPPAAKSEVGAKIRAILAEWKRFDEVNETAKVFAFTEAYSRKVYDEWKVTFVDTSRKLLALIEEDPADPASLEASLWHIPHYGKFGPTGPVADQIDRSVDVLLSYHGDEPRAVWRVSVMQTGMASRMMDRLLTGLVAASHRRESKGLALMALAEYLERKSEFVTLVGKADGPFYVTRTVAAQPRRGRPFDEAYERHLRSCDGPAMRREAEALFERVVAEYGDVVKAGRDPGDPDYPFWTSEQVLGRVAAAHLTGLRSVAVGEPAPDVSWRNADGSTSTLADYRGRVVVLGFWSNEFNMGAREHAGGVKLADRMKGRPFVLVGFARGSGADRLALPYRRPDGREVVPADDAIWSTFGIWRHPSTIVIDAKGVIRLHCGQRVLLDDYLDALVKEAESDE